MKHYGNMNSVSITAYHDVFVDSFLDFMDLRFYSEKLLGETYFT